MKHKSKRSWQTGKFSKVYCNCNDSWSRVMKMEFYRQKEVAHCGIGYDLCPDCCMNPWIYLSKADEPKGEPNP